MIIHLGCYHKLPFVNDGIGSLLSFISLLAVPPGVAFQYT